MEGPGGQEPRQVRADLVDAQGPVRRRQAKADELIGKADSASSPDEASKLLDQAAQQNPYRVDIPQKKAAIWYKATPKNMGKYGQALGEVVKIEPDNVAARNNLGVLQAQHEQWGSAMANISKAAMNSDSDTIMDNLDQVLAMAEADGVTGPALTELDRLIRQTVAQMHNAKKHVGDNRWGNKWVKEEDYQKYLRENVEISKKVIAEEARFEALKKGHEQWVAKKSQLDTTIKSYSTAGYSTGAGGYATPGTTYVDLTALNKQSADLGTQIKQAETEGKAIQNRIKTTLSTRNVPPHSGKLVLLDADGKAELESITPAGRRQGEAGGQRAVQLSLTGETPGMRRGLCAIPGRGCHGNVAGSWAIAG